MYSVVVPTMWRSDRTISLLEAYDKCDAVNEILLIDNDPASAPDYSHIEKLNVIHSGRNIYVNPSWNLGVAVSSCEDVIISNDDISFPVEETLNFMLESTYDCVGVHPKGINNPEPVEMELTEGNHIGNGWGVLMFVKKSKYKPIPSYLKVWFGDNWLNLTSKSVHSLTVNLQTEMSTTSNLSEMHPVIRMDINNWIAMTDMKNDRNAAASLLMS